MITCARCGAPTGTAYKNQCAATPGCTAVELLRCRDRELSNLQALLRSVTRRLENAREELSVMNALPLETGTHRALLEIDAVLEALS